MVLVWRITDNSPISQNFPLPNFPAIQYTSSVNCIKFPMVCYTSSKSFINKLCLGTKLWNFKVQIRSQILCAHMPYFLMLVHIYCWIYHSPLWVVLCTFYYNLRFHFNICLVIHFPKLASFNTLCFKVSKFVVQIAKVHG